MTMSSEHWCCIEFNKHISIRMHFHRHPLEFPRVPGRGSTTEHRWVVKTWTSLVHQSGILTYQTSGSLFPASAHIRRSSATNRNDRGAAATADDPQLIFISFTPHLLQLHKDWRLCCRTGNPCKIKLPSQSHALGPSYNNIKHGSAEIFHQMQSLHILMRPLNQNVIFQRCWCCCCSSQN